MPHYIAEQIITTKYKKTKSVNYRQQRDNLNILETCTFINCDKYRTSYDGHIDITRRKHSLGIQYKCKAQPHCASLGYPFRNTAAHTEATPTREGI